MKNIEKIKSAKVRFINRIDGKMEVKVYIINHCYPEANLRIDYKDLIAAGAIKTKGAYLKAEVWMNKNKEFVLNQINNQFPAFWNET